MGGTTAIDDTSAAKVAASLASLTRAANENVGSYNITGGTLNALTGTRTAKCRASLNTAGNTLAISQAGLTAAIANQSKTYGADDPSLSGIAVGLSGQVNRTVTNWMGVTTAIDDTSEAKVAASLASLTRAANENVGSYNITGGTLNALTGTSAGNYSASLRSEERRLGKSQAGRTAAIANQSKTYGADDPSLSGIAVGLSGQVNRTVTNWMGGTTAIDDTSAAKVAASLASLTRAANENVGSYNITGGTLNALTGTSAGNYSASLRSEERRLGKSQAGRTAAIANQSKTYGADDPSLSGIAVGLSGQVNRTVTNWMGGTTAIDDTSAAKVAASLASLTRAANENVGSYNITGGTLNALTGTSAGNYSASLRSEERRLGKSQAGRTAAIANQSKTYGADDPSLSGIAVGLSGQVNRTVTNWMGGTTAIDDTSAAKVAASLASLTRAANENVGSYNITGGTLNALTGTSAGNYSASLSTAGNTLAISQAGLTAARANQSKTYGQEDPCQSGIAVGFSAQVNRTVPNWMGGTTAITVTTSATLLRCLASLTRAANENVGSYNITGGTLNALTGTSAGNYSASLSTAGNTLAISQAGLTAAIANQSKTYGADDPSLSGIAPTLSGVINRTVRSEERRAATDGDTSAAKVAASQASQTPAAKG